MRTMLNELRSRAAEKESGDGGGGGWKLASEAAGVRTEWRPADEGVHERAAVRGGAIGAGHLNVANNSII